MELISKEELINKINAYMVTTPEVTMVRKLINELPSIDLIYCYECEFLIARELLDEPVKSRLPEEFIGKCDKTELYVHENDYCCGGSRGEE